MKLLLGLAILAMTETSWAQETMLCRAKQEDPMAFGPIEVQAGASGKTETKNLCHQKVECTVVSEDARRDIQARYYIEQHKKDTLDLSKSDAKVTKNLNKIAKKEDKFDPLE